MSDQVAQAGTDELMHEGDGHGEDKFASIRAHYEAGEELEKPVAKAVTRFTLRDGKVTTELYRTDYTTVTVLPETEVTRR